MGHACVTFAQKLSYSALGQWNQTTKSPTPLLFSRKSGLKPLSLLFHAQTTEGGSYGWKKRLSKSFSFTHTQSAPFETIHQRRHGSEIRWQAEWIRGEWLSGMDSNHDKSLQRALCYRYTTGQAREKVSLDPPCAKKKFRNGESRGTY
jgi:hypothetical protein